MAGIRLFSSNRLEDLVKDLAGILRDPLQSPLAQEIIVVQSRGMDRWLSLELAEHLGICANCSFPFPNAFVRDIFKRVIPDLPERSPFDPEILTWRIMTSFPGLIREPGFEGLRAYLGPEDAPSPLKRYQLSGCIADLYDQYLLFRPEMIARWEKGSGTHWQAVLWRQLVEGHEGRHRRSLAETVFEKIRGSAGTEGILPERVSVFGLSFIPPFYLEVLSALSEVSEINLFFMNPCREYWGDILTPRGMKRARLDSRGEGVPEGDLHFETGNSLLASLGTQGKDFFELLQGLDCEESSRYTDPGEATLLSSVQSDILNLRERPQAGSSEALSGGRDGSIQIHSCHNPMREMEVLRDALLDMFEQDPGLQPGDILVMAPDIETYAPFVQAVFGVPAEDPARIPFGLSDRALPSESGAVGTFLSLLDLHGGRFGAPEVMDILECPEVRGRFAIAEATMETLRLWVKETEIRWGIDREHRRKMGLPALEENTWRFGVERMLLGYALQAQGDRDFRGILPYGPIEGSEARSLGPFIAFLQELFGAAEDLGRPRTLPEWGIALNHILDTFFPAPGAETSEGDVQAMRRAVRDLVESGRIEAFQFDQPVDLPLIRWRLGRLLEEYGGRGGFLTGRVSFCSLLPMRSIPFRVICLVGMNADAYPRVQSPLGFDLMARHPRRGDRSRRGDDRYLFLESLLSARKILYISYIGQDVQEKGPVLPSSPVMELMDYIGRSCGREDGTLPEGVLTIHRFQGFHPDYFTPDSGLFSYSPEYCRTAGAFFEPKRTPAFIQEDLPEPAQELKTVTLQALHRFFKCPAGYLLKERLGVRMVEAQDVLEDREIFLIRGLTAYGLEEDLTQRRLGGGDLMEPYTAMRASGRLPHGSVGECLYRETVRDIEAFVNDMGHFLDKEVLPPQEIDVALGAFRITGRIFDVTAGGLRRYRYATLKGKDFLKNWIDHLVLNLCMEEPPGRSILVGKSDNQKKGNPWAAWSLGAVEDAEGRLLELLDIYWAGLCRPLHLFPGTSYAYIKKRHGKDTDRAAALDAAAVAWEGGETYRGEKEDTSYRICFGQETPLDEEFERLSERVFGPLLDHRKKEI